MSKRFFVAHAPMVEFQSSRVPACVNGFAAMVA
jgi:hypothetical protein